MIFIFANVLFFDDIFNLCEFQEKENIEYQLGRRAKSKDFHDDLRGSQRRNIEYQQGPRAKVNVFHVIQGVRMLVALGDGLDPPIRPLEGLGSFLGGFKVPMML